MKIKILILVSITIFSFKISFSQIHLDSFGKIDSTFKIKKYLSNVEKYLLQDDYCLRKDSIFLRNELRAINKHFKTKLFSKLICASAFNLNCTDSVVNNINVHFLELKFLKNEDCKRAMKFFDKNNENSWGKIKIYSNAVVKENIMFMVITSKVRNKKLIEFIEKQLKEYLL